MNHPDVRPFVGAPEAGFLDFTALVSRPEHLFPFGEHGGFFLIWTAPRNYEVHVALLPDGRGAWGFAAQDEVIETARAHGGAVLWARIDEHMPHLAQFARRGGMKPTGMVLETLGTPCQVYEMEIA